MSKPRLKVTVRGFITVDGNGLRITDSPTDGTLLGVVRTKDEFEAVIEKRAWRLLSEVHRSHPDSLPEGDVEIEITTEFLCSSSVAYPEESTNDEQVIALCRELNGA